MLRLRIACYVGFGPLLCACAAKQAAAPPQPSATATAVPAATLERAAVETVTVKDPDLERRVAQLELRLLEKEVQLEEAQDRLDEARQEVVRAMARLQSLATKAEAASGMAEAEVAMQSLKTSAGQRPTPELVQASRLLNLSGAEFNKQNYGGAVYLANQAKSLASAARGRLAGGTGESLRAGEVLFALPLPLRAAGRGNVREGPGQRFRVVFTVETGAPLTGYSYLDEWVRVTDASGGTGWIFRSLIGRRQSR